MNLRPLGETGLNVSPLGLGLAALGRPGYINLGHAGDLGRDYDVATMERRAHAVLDAAWQAGIRYFDVARSYGRAEAFLAAWLQARAIAPSAVTIGSKWGYTYTADWNVQATKHEVKEHSQAALQRQFAESHTLLGPYLAIYQIHSATRESGVLENRPVLTELTRLRATGVKIGLTLSGPAQGETLRRAIEVTVDGVRLFDCVQATWNLLEPSAGPALGEAHAAGLGVIVKEPLANGRLTARNDDPAFSAQRRMLDVLTKELNASLDALALAAALAQPWADTVLSGATTVAQLQSNLAAVQIAWNGDLGERLAALAESPDAYWSKRGQLTWN